MTPELISPIDVHIERLDKVETVYDDDIEGAFESNNDLVRKPVVILPAQVAFENTEQVTRYQALAPDENVKGYMVLRYLDLDNAGVKLQRGDFIVKMGTMALGEDEYVLLHSQGDPAATLGGDFTLVRMFFGDKKPLE